MSYEARHYLDPATLPLPFCPGCSHSTVLNALAEALASLQLPPQEVVLVTDIGCIGISDRHFRTHTFHGLHGRSVTYATGLKLANPDLHVVVLVGDGGLGIGGHHFLHAARRNLDITVLVCNNFNFGMTGGQHSATTPHEALTATTSAGNFEHPLNVTGLVDAAGGNFAARAMFWDKALPYHIAEAISIPGFAVVETWELCTAYFAKRNRAGRAFLESQLADLGLETGVVVRRTRPGYVEQYRRGVASLAGQAVSRGMAIEAEFPRSFLGRKTVMIAGRAGQKVRSGAILLGRAAVLSSLHATQRDDYPVTVMTGHSIAEMIFEDGPINELGVVVPDYVVLTAPEGKKVASARLAALPAESTVFTIPELLPIETRARVVSIPTAELGLDRKKTWLVLGALGYFVHVTGLVDFAALTRAATLESREAIAADNLGALATVKEFLDN